MLAVVIPSEARNLALASTVEPTRKDAGQPRSRGERLKRVAVGALFFLILLIPRVRRLRRRVRVWTAIRIAVGLVALLLGWRFFNGGNGWFASGSLALLLFAALARATPVKKSLNDRAHELGALAVLNGGVIIPPSGDPVRKVNIFASAERLIVEDGEGRTVLEIALAKVQRCAADGLEPGEGKPWDLEITWDSPNQQTARFHFEGFFAEHLAGIAQSTVENLRRRELPVLKG